MLLLFLDCGVGNGEQGVCLSYVCFVGLGLQLHIESLSKLLVNLPKVWGIVLGNLSPVVLQIISACCDI